MQHVPRIVSTLAVDNPLDRRLHIFGTGIVWQRQSRVLIQDALIGGSEIFPDPQFLLGHDFVLLFEDTACSMCRSVPLSQMFGNSGLLPGKVRLFHDR